MGGHGRALWWEGRRAFVGMGNHGRAGGREGMGRAAYYKMQDSPTLNMVWNAMDVSFHIVPSKFGNFWTETYIAQ